MRRQINFLEKNGKQVKIMCVGRKARDVLRRSYANIIIKSFEDLGHQNLSYDSASEVADHVLQLFEKDQFDICTIVFNRFQSAISQIVTSQQLIPLGRDKDISEGSVEADNLDIAVHVFEPSEEEILSSLLPRNIAVQIFRALLESAASEHGARMTAMDNATRNAGEMIDDLTLTYNRTRQAVITSELIEIISGAEAL